MSKIKTTSFTLKSGFELTIRNPRKEDAQDLIDFIEKVTADSKYLLISENEFSLSLEQEKQWIESNNNDDGAVILIGEIDSKIIAITNAKSGGRKRNSHVAHLGTSVSKEFRSLGIGKLMMSQLIDWAKEHEKIEFLQLSVMGDNLPAQNLYKSLGFQKTGETPFAYKYSDGSYQSDITMSLNVTT